jgi:hypothetical protein
VATAKAIVPITTFTRPPNRISNPSDVADDDIANPEPTF